MHRYRLINRKTGEVMWENTNTACFAQFNNGQWNQDTKRYNDLFDKNNDLVFYWLDYNRNLVDSSIKFIEELAKIGIPIKAVEGMYNKEPAVVFTLNLEKCKTHQMAIFALHFARFAWDSQAPQCVKEACEYQKKHKCSFWLAFTAAKKYMHRNSSHETWYIHNHYKIQTQKSLKAFVKILKSDFYIHEAKFSWFTNQIRIPSTTALAQQVSRDTTPKVFKNLIKLKENEVNKK